MRGWLVALALCLPAWAGARDCPPAPTPPTPVQAQRWAEQAPDRGLLWRISRDGVSSYLFGSLHLGRADWAYPGPALRAAWAATEVLAVELDPADVTPAQAAPESAPPPAGITRRLATQATAACLPPPARQALQAWPPVMQLATLTLLAARRDGFDVGFGQDLMLIGRARAEGRPVLALESAQEQLAALQPESPADAQALLDGGLRQLENGQLRVPLRRLAEAWRQGDLAALADYPRWCRCADTAAERRWLQRLNDERNQVLAERIAALHGPAQRMLIAVGALHMSGPQALPGLLRQRGFEVEQILPDSYHQQRRSQPRTQPPKKETP